MQEINRNVVEIVQENNALHQIVNTRQGDLQQALKENDMLMRENQSQCKLIEELTTKYNDKVKEMEDLQREVVEFKPLLLDMDAKYRLLEMEKKKSKKEWNESVSVSEREKEALTMQVQRLKDALTMKDVELNDGKTKLNDVMAALKETNKKFNEASLALLKKQNEVVVDEISARVDRSAVVSILEERQLIQESKRYKAKIQEQEDQISALTHEIEKRERNKKTDVSKSTLVSMYSYNELALRLKAVEKEKEMLLSKLTELRDMNVSQESNKEERNNNAVYDSLHQRMLKSEAELKENKNLQLQLMREKSELNAQLINVKNKCRLELSESARKLSSSITLNKANADALNEKIVKLTSKLNAAHNEHTTLQHQYRQLELKHNELLSVHKAMLHKQALEVDRLKRALDNVELQLPTTDFTFQETERIQHLLNEE